MASRRPQAGASHRLFVTVCPLDLWWMLPSVWVFALKHEERVQKAFLVDHHGPEDARLSHSAKPSLPRGMRLCGAWCARLARNSVSGGASRRLFPPVLHVRPPVGRAPFPVGKGRGAERARRAPLTVQRARQRWCSLRGARMCGDCIEETGSSLVYCSLRSAVQVGSVKLLQCPSRVHRGQSSRTGDGTHQ